MEMKIYQVDAFAEKVFSGNPAAVCPLEVWLEDNVLQQIAMENNLAETAFYVREQDRFQIRWFTPSVEVDLCGHATLAAAYVLFNHEGFTGGQVHFYSPRSGNLMVKKEDDALILDFPADHYEPAGITAEITACFDIKPLAAYRGKTDLLLVFGNENDIRHIRPSLDRIEKLKVRGVIVTARGNEVDFVSRFFAPQSGVNEDPVTGSAHTTLAPFWGQQLGKEELSAVQLSARGGFLTCYLKGDRVEIRGKAKLYLKGEIYID